VTESLATHFGLSKEQPVNTLRLREAMRSEILRPSKKPPEERRVQEYREVDDFGRVLRPDDAVRSLGVSKDRQTFRTVAAPLEETRVRRVALARGRDGLVANWLPAAWWWPRWDPLASSGSSLDRRARR
jgi:hypothetical protein